MILTYIIYAAFTGVIFYRIYYDFRSDYPRTVKEFIRRNIRPLLVLLIIGLSLFTVKFIIGERPFSSSQEAYTYARKFEDKQLQHQAYEEAIFDGDRDPRVVSEYIRSSQIYPNKLDDLRRLLTSELKSPDVEKQDFARIFIFAIELETSRSPDVRLWLDQVQNRAAPYLNYYYGEYYQLQFDINTSIDYYREEIATNGNVQGAALSIIELTIAFFPDQYEALYYDPLVAPQIDLNERFEYYFLNGEWKLYLNCYIERYTSTVNFLGFLAALIITFLWMHYIRSFDIFERERWLPLLSTFFLSCLMLFLVYPITDFLRLYAGFNFNESAIGDFLYSVVAIGGVEELVKFLPWLIMLKLTKQINEPFDYILYASVSALGFAFMENLKYYQEAELHIISDRAITAVISHMFDASVVAYAFIIARYRLTDKRQKILVQALGFVLAAVFHGFYDFWLISEYGMGFFFLTFLFMLGTMRVWMIMKNNALNLSSLTGTGLRLNHQIIADNLVLGLVVIAMFEYIIIAIDHGSKIAGAELAESSKLVIFVGIYLMIEMSRIKIRKGLWKKIAFKDFIPSFFIREKVIGGSSTKSQQIALRFFAPKSNPYVGTQFPVVGHYNRDILISGHEWPLYKLEKPVSVNNNQAEFAAVRPKEDRNTLRDDKVEVIMLFPRISLDIDKPDLQTTDLLYVGALFSRPVGADHQ